MRSARGLRRKGAFEIIDELGEGGFAHVYRAREVATGRTVALKVLKDAFIDQPEIVERFRREIFAIASIDSPHVVKLYDFGVSGKECYIAMDFVEGPTLRQVIKTSDWRIEDVRVIVGQVAQALAAAHKNRILHRDLKPENILFYGKDEARQVKVVDFGFAKLIELERKLDLEPLTRTGLCFGTPQYMSPEQVMGRPSDASFDLFALCVIAYELSAGFLPWDGDEAREVMRAVVSYPPPTIKTAKFAGTNLDRLNEFFQRALSRNKQVRPPDAEALYREFEAALLGPQAAAATDPFRFALSKTINLSEIAHHDSRDTQVEGDGHTTVESGPGGGEDITHTQVDPQRPPEEVSRRDSTEGRRLLTTRQLRAHFLPSLLTSARTTQPDAVDSIVIDEMPPPNATSAPAASPDDAARAGSERSKSAAPDDADQGLTDGPTDPRAPKDGRTQTEPAPGLSGAVPRPLPVHEPTERLRLDAGAPAAAAQERQLVRWLAFGGAMLFFAGLTVGYVIARLFP